jgi:hypothetical protein
VKPAAAGLRIGDAERAAAADRLAWHFSHGRLDQAELDDRLDRAMRATTAGDLAELFTDLPADGPVTATAASSQPRPVGASPQPARTPRRRGREAVLLVVCIIAALFVAHALAHVIIVLAVVGLVAVLVLRARRVRERGSPPSTP